MENTEKVLFEDDQPQWYVAMGEKWIGPIRASEVYERVTSQKITWAHFVWRQGEKEWKRLCDVRTFAAAVPEQPSRSLQREVKESSQEISKPVVKQATQRTEQPAKAEKGWFLYYNETQFGPFEREEVVRFLHTGKITPRVHAWRTGMATWTRLQELNSFKPVIAEVKPAAEASAPVTKTDLRKAPRRPMVAKVLLASGSDVTDALCRDISVGGMQVLTETIPGKVGEKIKLNVSATQIEPFVAEGIIVRVLEDQKGFSFRFERLSDQARRSIEQYISS